MNLKLEYQNENKISEKEFISWLKGFLHDRITLDTCDIEDIKSEMEKIDRSVIPANSPYLYPTSNPHLITYSHTSDFSVPEVLQGPTKL